MEGHDAVQLARNNDHKDNILQYPQTISYLDIVYLQTISDLDIVYLQTISYMDIPYLRTISDLDIVYLTQMLKTGISWGNISLG